MIAPFPHTSSSDATQRADRLARAAVAAFGALTRPSRQEVAQLEDLISPLLPDASRETLRYVAAALSDNSRAPAGLVRWLCRQPVEICAPLLVRSHVLNDADLIALIGRHGLGHARAIARRADLNPRIRELIALIERSAAASGNEVAVLRPDAASPLPRVEAARQRLRTMMRTRGHDEPETGDEARRNLRMAALSGSRGLFITALCRALGTRPEIVDGVLAERTEDALASALRALGFAVEEAFLVAFCARPQRFAHADAARRFVEIYGRLTADDIAGQLHAWRADGLGWAVTRRRASG